MVFLTVCLWQRSLYDIVDLLLAYSAGRSWRRSCSRPAADSVARDSCHVSLTVHREGAGFRKRSGVLETETQ